MSAGSKSPSASRARSSATASTAGIDAEVAAHPERDAGMPRAGARERGRPVVLEMPGGEQHERDRDDVGVPARDQLVDPGVDQRLGELDEPEPDRQIGGGLAHVLGERPELLEPVGVAAAVADDEQRGAHSHHQTVTIHGSAANRERGRPTRAAAPPAVRSSVGMRPS